jgi:ATPase subunit of ABC transporter with duplicated ATPase domains
MPCAISAQDRIVITWPNGSWKTSFLNTLYDLLWQRKTEESVVVGNNITVVYLDQHNKWLDQNMIIAQWFRLYRWQVHDHQIVATLLNHGLTHRHLSQKLSVLSHGQRIRLQLLAVTQMKPDVVILDEPTNHCDIATREAIEDMLLAYQWCVVCVSHDRYFTERIGCMRCLSIENGYLVEI